MPSSLLPERPLLISPTLAQTIGLEEAVMLQVLADMISQRESSKRPLNPRLEWIKVNDAELQEVFPFWAPVDIKRVQASLHALGVILIDGVTSEDSGNSHYFAIEDNSSVENPVTNTSNTVPSSKPKPAGKTALIPANWQPDDNWLKLCKQHSIPEQFALELVPEFVFYWRERGEARFSWGNAFYKHVLKEWRNEQTRKGTYELASNMSAEWRPNTDALGILVNAGINASFIEDAIPEFVLYWRERGAVHGAWNTKFIEHIRRQWAKFSASFGHDDTPQVIPADWQPSAECYEILQLAEIDEEYARSRIPEFVLYWRDSQQVKASWNTVFLQFIKQDWAHKLKQFENADINYADDQTIVGSSQQKIKERFQRIADRSWAE
ncbi:MAG: DnaT-like ssDNA-binding domain-containing protein [Proteobacteria bacterium]|nr:DnaT-like ssDNA-binding domain-containing protein [Pseudomonadota bacterium]